MCKFFNKKEAAISGLFFYLGKYLGIYSSTLAGVMSASYDL